MQNRLALTALLVFATPAVAQQIECSGAFGVDSSAARLIEIYGADNVVTGDVDGPEGTTMLATTVFPDEPKQRLEFIWLDEVALTKPASISLSSKSIAPGGIRIGMPIAEVQAINGEPFTVTGFGWDYGGYAWFASGALAQMDQGCWIGVRFATGAYPDTLDVSTAMGDLELSSDYPLLQKMDVRLSEISIGYDGPDDSD